MGKDSRIEWTHHTFNPWWGCVRVSAACDHCYAETGKPSIETVDDHPFSLFTPFPRPHHIIGYSLADKVMVPTGPAAPQAQPSSATTTAKASKTAAT